MKKRLLIILITGILLLFMALPVSASMGTPPAAAENAGTEVTAKAEPIYVFAAPVGATITYPQTQANLGDFVVSDLFMESGEWLTVTVTPGLLYKTDLSGAIMPYGLIFNPPETLNHSNIGQRYGASAEIDPNVLASASPGTYQAIVRFRVTSYPDHAIVWEGSAVLTVIRNTSTDESTDSFPSASSQVTTSQQVSSVSAVSAAASTPAVSSKLSVVTIETEPTPGETPKMGAIVMRYGFVFAVLALSVLIVLTRVIGRRKKSD